MESKRENAEPIDRNLTAGTRRAPDIASSVRGRTVCLVCQAKLISMETCFSAYLEEISFSQVFLEQCNCQSARMGAKHKLVQSVRGRVHNGD